MQATIYGVHVDLLSLLESTVSPPMLFSIISCMIFLLNCKVGINFPPLRKCPSASVVFTSVTAKYHTKFLSGQNLVAHVILIEIGACLLLMWSSTWWRYRKCKPNAWREFNSLARESPSRPLYSHLVSAPSNSSSECLTFRTIFSYRLQHIHMSNILVREVLFNGISRYTLGPLFSLLNELSSIYTNLQQGCDPL